LGQAAQIAKNHYKVHLRSRKKRINAAIEQNFQSAPKSDQPNVKRKSAFFALETVLSPVIDI